MNHSNSSNSQLSVSPLGAGDLIDRSVRFYRKHFWTFVFIASPPIIIGAVFLIGWTILARNLFSVNSANPDEATFYTIFIYLGGFFIWCIQLIAVFVVMGGASRNFVRHILFDEPIAVRETYKNVKSRFGGLLFVSGMLVLLLGFFGFILFYFGILVAAVSIALAAWLFSFLPVLALLVSLALGLAAIYGTLWVFFLVTSRFVYVPQVMLVEGMGAFSAISRSTSLAGKNVRRVGSLFIFTLVATASAIALLYVPLIIYSSINGIDIFGFEADLIPAWIQISKQVIFELSLILLTPILMIGLCLLYIDERVRSEGYDIELMAAKRLGSIPTVPRSYVNPLQPALADTTLPKNNPPPPQPRSKINNERKAKYSTNSILGLD